MAAAACCSVLAACSGGPAVRVSPPRGEDPRACSRLQEALPGKVAGQDRRDTLPTSDRTAAWGDPPVVLRCGVARPSDLRPTSQLLEIDGVEWFLDERRSAFVFTTVHRQAYVEVRVPGATPRERATNPLVDLAPAIQTGVRAA